MDKIIKNDDITEFMQIASLDFLKLTLFGENEEKDDTPLIRACRHNAFKIIDFLLKNGADVNQTKPNGITPLYISAQDGKDSIVETLLKLGALPNQQANSEFDCAAPLHIAATHEHVTTIKLLLAYGADPNLISLSGNTALHAAAETGNIDVLEALISTASIAKINLNIHNKCGYTPLWFSIAKKQHKFAACLIKHGADVNCRELNGVTPLLHAMLNDDFAAVDLVLENHADVNMQCKNGSSALFTAIVKDNIRYVDLLLQRGANPNISCNASVYFQSNTPEQNWKLCPLHCATLGKGNNSCRIIGSLLEKGASIDKLDTKGKTALIYAVCINHLQAATLLLEKGANPNIKYDADMTLIYIAVVRKYKSLVELLIKNGADLTIVSTHGSIEQFAISSGDTKILDLIRNPNQVFAEKPSWFSSWFSRKN